MRLLGIVVFALVSSLTLPLPATAMWSLGGNLGVTIHDPSEPSDETVTIVGIPSQASFLSSLRPGLRAGFTTEAMVHETYLDLSYDYQSSGGDNLHVMRLGMNYQYNFSGQSMRPYITAGIGLFSEGGDLGFGSVGATSFTFGGGLGLGFPVSDRMGRLRVEARVDRLGEGEDDGVPVINEATVFQGTFGFDLWMK